MIAIMQYSDCIVSASLNDRSGWKELCSPSDMVRRHLVRGYKDQVYFAETSQNAATIYKLEIHKEEV